MRGFSSAAFIKARISNTNNSSARSAGISTADWCLLTHSFAPVRYISRVPVQKRHGQDEVDGNSPMSSRFLISIDKKDVRGLALLGEGERASGGSPTWPCTQSSGKGPRLRTGGATGSRGPGMRRGRSRARRRGDGPPSGTPCLAWPRQSACGRGPTGGHGARSCQCRASLRCFWLFAIPLSLWDSEAPWGKE